MSFMASATGATLTLYGCADRAADDFGDDFRRNGAGAITGAKLAINLQIPNSSLEGRAAYFKNA